MSVQVKICGLKRPEDVFAVNDAKADYAGFVFFEKSRRNISFEKARELLPLLNPGIRSAAVCVSPKPEFVRGVSRLGFDIIQMHGSISDEILDLCDIPVWQAVNLSEKSDLKKIIKHPNIRGYVIDGADYGGGRTFGWEDDDELATSAAKMIREALGNAQFILAGGLNPDNVSAGIRIFSPDIADVSSGVETDGIKDGRLIKKFIYEVRSL